MGEAHDPKKKSYAAEDRLSQEVLRKLSLATKADQKEDRDIICSEVFADITEELNESALKTVRFERPLGNSSSGKKKTVRWYQVLAPFFVTSDDTSVKLLSLCKKLWGQPFTAPVFALLLHQWLLLDPEAGGSEERLKHINILVSGSRQLFLGDVDTNLRAFEPLFRFFFLLTHKESDLGDDDLLLLGLVASFLPYYSATNEGEFADYLGSNTPERVDFMVGKMVDTLAKDVRADEACITYLKVMVHLNRNNLLSKLRTSTRIRLQGTLYSLTRPGGPRYASRAVNKVAFHALDQLFPHGRRTRRMINLMFRFLFAQEWPWVCWDFLCAVWGFLLGIVSKISSLFLVRTRNPNRKHGYDKVA